MLTAKKNKNSNGGENSSNRSMISGGIAKKEHVQQRVNLSQIKKLIDRHLGDRRNLYWNTFVKYMQAKLSKTEWDHFMKITFGYEFIHLHNYFVKCLFFNARLSTNQQQTSSRNLSGRTSGVNNMMMLLSRDSNAASELGPISVHRSLLKHNASEFRLNLLSQQISEQQTKNTSGTTTTSIMPPSLLDITTSNSTNTMLSPNTTNAIVSSFTSGSSGSKGSIKTMQFWSKEFVQVRMNKIADELGLLNGVDPECINLLMQSTEYYIKHLITKCLQYKKQNDLTKIKMKYKKPEAGSYLVRDGKYVYSYRHYEDDIPYLSKINKNKEEEDEDVEMTDPNEDIDKFVITPKDLVFTVDSCPYLVDDLNLKEKISNLDWDLY
ncbi:hypothetical protein ABK040_015832 [Willaertia magna]